MTVRYSASGGVARIALDRPPLNILDIATSRLLEAACRRAAADRSVRVVVLSGRGKCFSAGVDIADHKPGRVRGMLKAFHGAVRALHGLPQPTVAQVHGHCLGGGMELALACDFVVASRGSVFGQPEIRLACFPPVAAVLLPGRVGAARANELLMLGGTISAARAREWGLVNAIGRSAEPLVRQLLGLSGAALKATKAAIRVATAGEFERALKETEKVYLENLARTRDMGEGVEAFLEKRRPRWGHR